MTACFNLLDLQAALPQGQWLNAEPLPLAPFAISTDTRTLQPGDAFLALSGPNFDGHDHLQAAFKQGASLAIVAKAKANTLNSINPPLFLVDEPLMAYLALASYHRQRSKATVVALTGSSGKTTVKELLASVFSQAGKTQATLKNNNNEVGLSQTLLALEPDTQFLVTEMGMRGLGQIRLLTQYAKPNVAMVLNVGPAHIGLLGSLEAIAEAKCEIAEGLEPPDGLFIYKSDDPLIEAEYSKHLPPKTQVLGFNRNQAQGLQANETGCYHFKALYQGELVAWQAPLPGLHQIDNALAVLKVAESLGLSASQVAQGFLAIQTQKGLQGRGEKKSLPGHANSWLINDAYNANPQSMQASLQTFLAQSAGESMQKILILGSMAELGDLHEHYHQQLGQFLAQQTQKNHALKGIILVGEGHEATLKALQASGCPVLQAGQAEAVPFLLETLLGEPPWQNVTLLFKGSRAHRLEVACEALLKLDKAVVAP